MELKFKAQRKSSEEWNYLNLGEYLTTDEKLQPDMLQYLHRNICQFTGLKDKNGVEIYEGDILLGRNSEGKESGKDVVIFEHGQFKGKYSPKPLINYTYSLSDKTVEIIGNIYDNPELLATI